MSGYRAPSVPPFAWYALRVRSRSEQQVKTTLEGKHLECYFPFNTVIKKWADRTRTAEVPLFPGYVFARFDVNKRLPILKTPNVSHIVGIGKIPVPIEDYEIESLSVVGAAHLTQSAVDLPIAGEKIVIECGPLAGVTGTLIRANKGSRLVVSVGLLCRAVSVEVDQSWISSIAESRFIKAHAA